MIRVRMTVFPRRRRAPQFIRLLVAAVALAFVAGCVTRPKAHVDLAQFAPAQRERARENLAVFNGVWDLVNRKHYEVRTDGVDWEQLGATYGLRAAAAPDEASLYAVLNEMLDELHDSHTHALTPAQATERHTHERARTGFAMVRIDDAWVVADVVPDSPAAAAGVKAGWVVVSRNGEPLERRPDFRAREGDEIHWVFLDQANHPVPITLRAITLSTAALQVERTLAGGLVYLRFDEFDVADRRWLGRQMRQHVNAPGLIIDLRRNSGGDVTSLGIVIGQFFDHAVDCGTFVSRRGTRTVKKSWQFGSVHYHGRVVVLIDANSASAAEIFAAVMKDHQRATIIGRKSAGAVLASVFFSLPDGGELQLSRDDYLAPNGRRIENNGVEPDVVVTRTVDDLRAGRDPDMDAAVRILAGAPPRVARASRP
jgi:carboxyl-terminal processing protease